MSDKLFRLTLRSQQAGADLRRIREGDRSDIADVKERLDKLCTDWQTYIDAQSAELQAFREGPHCEFRGNRMGNEILGLRGKLAACKAARDWCFAQ